MTGSPGLGPAARVPGASLLFIAIPARAVDAEDGQGGNAAGIVGMVIAVVVTTLALLAPGAATSAGGEAWGLLAAAIAVGAAIGAMLAARVAMTSMPELVAILHSFVGAAAVLVGVANYLEPSGEAASPVHAAEIVVGVVHRRGDLHRLGRRLRQAPRHAWAASRCCCPGGT